MDYNELYDGFSASKKFIDTIKNSIQKSESLDHQVGLIKESLRKVFDLSFSSESGFWLALLCAKWNDKTPDINVQAEKISEAIIKQIK